MVAPPNGSGATTTRQPESWILDAPKRCSSVQPVQKVREIRSPKANEQVVVLEIREGYGRRVEHARARSLHLREESRPFVVGAVAVVDCQHMLRDQGRGPRIVSKPRDAHVARRRDAR